MSLCILYKNAHFSHLYQPTLSMFFFVGRQSRFNTFHFIIQTSFHPSFGQRFLEHNMMTASYWSTRQWILIHTVNTETVNWPKILSHTICEPPDETITKLAALSSVTTYTFSLPHNTIQYNKNICIMHSSQLSNLRHGQSPGGRRWLYVGGG